MVNAWAVLTSYCATDAGGATPQVHWGIGVGLGTRVYTDQMWELACLRKRYIRHRMHQLTARLREQARSHRRIRVCLGLPGVSRSNVGAGLPAKAVGQHRMHQLPARLREQARSHRGIRVCLGLPGVRRSNVGAGLPAKAVGQLPNASTDTPPSRASPLQQGDPGMAWAPGCTQIKCGSWLACEGGRSGTHRVN